LVVLESVMAGFAETDQQKPFLMTGVPPSDVTSPFARADVEEAAVANKVTAVASVGVTNRMSAP
jgi:hypothetical protein